MIAESVVESLSTLAGLPPVRESATSCYPFFPPDFRASWSTLYFGSFFFLWGRSSPQTREFNLEDYRVQ